MTARERLQYFQSDQGDVMLVDPNYLSSLMTNNLPYHNGVWTTLLPMSDASVPQAIIEGRTPSLDSTASKSVTRDEKRRSDNWASQRAYRDRKAQHVINLERDVHEIERKFLQLLGENRKYVRDLCEIRVNNKDLRRGCLRSRTQYQQLPPSESRGSLSTQTTPPSRSSAAARLNSFRSQVNEDTANQADSPTESLSGTWDELRSTYTNMNDNVVTEAMLETLIELIDNGINLAAHPLQPVRSIVDRLKTKQ